MPRTPPPSSVKTRIPAVGGKVLTTVPDVVSPQKKQLSTSKSQGSCSFLAPKTRTQFSQMQCPQGRRYCGLLRRQTRHVSSERRESQSRLDLKRSRRCRSTEVLTVRRLRSPKSLQKVPSIILTNPEGRTRCAEPSCANSPSLHAW